MSGQHTPGPWRAVQCTGRVHRAADEWLVTAPGVEEVVCRVERWTPEQDEADARLIAAAPRLAEALERLLDLVDELHPDGFPEGFWPHEAVAAARAALREAGVEP